VSDFKALCGCFLGKILILVAYLLQYFVGTAIKSISVFLLESTIIAASLLYLLKA